MNDLKMNYRKRPSFQKQDKPGKKRYKLTLENLTDEAVQEWSSVEKVFAFCSVGREPTRKIRLEICKELGADVSLIEKDLLLYEEFHKMHYADMNCQRRFFDRYYKPLAEAVGVASLREEPTDQSSQLFMQVVVNKKKGQWSTVSMWTTAMKIMRIHHGYFSTLLKSVRFIESSEFWKHVKSFCQEKEKDVVCCPITKKPVNQKQVFQDLCKLKERFESDPETAGDVSLEEALHFSNTPEGSLSASKIVVLLSTGFKHVDELRRANQKREIDLLAWEEMFLKMQCSFNGAAHVPVFLELSENVNGNLDNIKHLPVEDLCEVITKSTEKKNTYKIIEFVLRDRVDSLEYLGLHLHSSYTNKLVTDVFQSTPWRKNLFQVAMKSHQKRVVKSSINPSLRIKEISYMAAKHLFFMADYAQKNFQDKIPLEIDPLRWFLASATPETLEQMIVAYGTEYQPNNALVKSTQDRHHASYVISMFTRLLREDLKPFLLSSGKIDHLVPSKILQDIDNLRVSFDSTQRRVYTDEEVSRMLSVAKTHPPYELIITLFREIGLRVGSISIMKYYDLVDECHKPRHVCKVMEKNKKYRQFLTSHNLKQVLVAYIRYVEVNLKTVRHSDFYAFNLRKPYQKLCTETIRKRLKKIGQSAEVEVVVHPHVFRHTIVGKLIDAGNSMETVSKFIGHAGTDVTYRHYWLKGIKDLEIDLRNPFGAVQYSKEELQEEKDEALELAQKKIDTCLGILHVYNLTISEAIKNNTSAEQIHGQIISKIPNIQRLLNNIASSVSSTSSN
jgi:integrase